MTMLGRFAYFVVGAHVLLWEVGNAKHVFPDTAKGAVVNIVLFELAPCVLGLHWHLLGHIAGDYSLNGALFQSWQGPLVFAIGLLVLCPIVFYLVCAWHRAGLLRQLMGSTCIAAVLVVLLTLLFSLAGWGLHLHHYFLGLLGYLGARGNSRPATLTRALCLGVLINGLSHWGDTPGIPIWSEGSGWYPPQGNIDTDAQGVDGNQVVFIAADGRMNGSEVLLKWALMKDLRASNCSDPPEFLNGSIGEPVFVLEMNHIEIYRGGSRSLASKLPGPGGRHFFRVGLLSSGLARSAVTVSRVLAFPLAVPYTTSLNACARAKVLTNQPSSALDGYI